MNRTLIAAAVVLAFAGPALGQEPAARHEHRFVFDGHDVIAQAADARATADAMRQWGDDLRASMGAMFGDHFSAAKAVKGAPYSADISTEANQSLADGNVISKKTTGRVHRDGEGRTRQETVVNGEAKSIQLRDPVEGTAVMLLPGTKKAVPAACLHGGSGPAPGDGDPHRDGKVTVDGKECGELESGGKEIVVETAGHRRQGETGDGTKREEVRVHVVRRPGGEGGPHAHAGDAPPGARCLPRFDARSSSPGASPPRWARRRFDGVRAQGKSVDATPSRRATSATGTRSWSRASRGTRRSCR